MMVTNFGNLLTKSTMASPTVILLLVSFLDTMAVTLILPHLDSHAKELGFNHIQIGLVRAVFSGCQMISSPIVGSLSDVIGRKRILLFCLITCSSAYFWMGITSSIFMFLCLRAILGTFKQTQFLTRTLAPDYMDDPNKVAVLYGRLMSVGALGVALGPVLSGHIMEAYPKNGFTLICAILSSLFLINISLISLLPDITNVKKDKSEEVPAAPKLMDSIVNTLKRSINKFYIVDWTKYWDIFLFRLLMSLCIGLYYNNFSLFLKTQHNVSPVNLGYIIALQAVMGSIINNSIVFINKIYINDRDYSQRIFHIFLVVAFSLLGLAVAPSVYMYIALLIPKAGSFALARIVTLEVLTSRCVTGNRGTLIGASNSVKSISGILTPIIGGFINQYLGVTYAFPAGALFAIIGVVISYRLRSTTIKEKVN